MRFRDLFLRSLKSHPDPLAVEVLIERAFGLARTEFWLKRDEEIGRRAALRTFYRHLARLKNSEPLAYIIGEKDFFSQTFRVGRGVLVPRPETEILVEKALLLICEPVPILDIGAGCGAIAITLAARTGSSVVATESSGAALRILEENICRFRLQQQVRPLQADLFPPTGARFRLIAANPPYLARREWQELPPTVRCFEPYGALVAGESGLEAISRIVSGAKNFLQPDGWLLLEVGRGQKSAVERLLAAAGFRQREWARDLQGIERVVAAGTPEL